MSEFFLCKHSCYTASLRVTDNTTAAINMVPRQIVQRRC